MDLAIFTNVIRDDINYPHKSPLSILLSCVHILFLNRSYLYSNSNWNIWVGLDIGAWQFAQFFNHLDNSINVHLVLYKYQGSFEYAIKLKRYYEYYFHALHTYLEIKIIGIIWPFNCLGNKLKSLKVAKWRKYEWKIMKNDEGWIKKDEGWIKKDEGWRMMDDGWMMKDDDFKLLRGFEDRQTIRWTDGRTDRHLWL